MRNWKIYLVPNDSYEKFYLQSYKHYFQVRQKHTKMIREVPTQLSKPNNNRTCSVYRSCGCNRRPSRSSLSILDTPRSMLNLNRLDSKWSQLTRVNEITKEHPMMTKVRWTVYLRVSGEPVRSLAVVVTFLNPLLEPLALDRIVPCFTTCKTVHIRTTKCKPKPIGSHQIIICHKDAGRQYSNKKYLNGNRTTSQ